MRIVLLSLLAALASGPAAAECNCLCVRGEARGVCSQTAETPPICQQLCPVSLSPQAIQAPLSPQSLGGGGGGGGLDALAGAASGVNAQGAARLGRGF